ncbi:hypothetical protein RZS08_41740, partial [Arthrospira platensis SPKY1]|nr:hypothetical protein [Arthrospira platensis SPKY1]
MLHDVKDPLVVASVEYLFPIYKEVASYSNVQPGFVQANPEHTDLMLLHEKAWDIVAPQFDRERTEKKALFEQFATTNRTASDIHEIMPAALEGKVDTLFIENRTDIWGVYDPASDTVRLQEQDEPANVSLLNLLAIEVFLK